jgi:patatin-like phospholipase/acyl hydrolase
LERPFKILSLDGGGLRGAFSASVLAAMEEQSGVRLVDYFDLIAGTSTGGIIALAIAAGIPARDILAFYISHGPLIFSPATGLEHVGRLIASVVRPKHAHGPLRAALEDVFAGRVMGELQTRVVIPTFSATAGRIRLMKTPHHPRLSRDHSRTLVDVALATSAAPYYLPSFTSTDGERFIDGGVWANDPIAVAVVEAVGYLDIPPESVRVLSVGTTTEPYHVEPGTVRRGLLGLAWGLINGQSLGLFTAGQASAAQAQARVLLKHADVIQRIDPIVREGRFRMDQCRDLDELRGMGQDSATRAMPEIRRRFLDQVAAHPLPSSK